MRSDINIIIVIVIATSEWRAPRGRVCLIQDTRCGHAWLTQIRRVPYGPGERSDAFPGRSPVLPCRWPQLWHIGIRSVLLWVTLPCAGRRKTLQLWWTTATHSRSRMLFSSHTHTQTNKLSVSGDVYLRLWIQREKQTAIRKQHMARFWWNTSPGL